MNLNGNAFKPINFWSWNGLMEEEEVRWQIKEFKNKARREIENLTAMNVVSLQVIAKSVYIPEKEEGKNNGKN